MGERCGRCETLPVLNIDGAMYPMVLEVVLYLLEGTVMETLN